MTESRQLYIHVLYSSVREQLLVMLAHCFYRLTLCDREPARVINRVQWLLEIMGHVRNIVTRQVPLSNSEVQLSKVVYFNCRKNILSLCLRKPTNWVQTRSDTNLAVRSQKQDFGLKKKRHCTICIVKTKMLISIFVFA